MSSEAEALLAEAKESIEAAQNYRQELTLRLHSLSQAKKQVRGSSSASRETLRRHFGDLQASVSRLLTERLNELLAEVERIETSALRPLEDCHDIITQGVNTADQLLREGEEALRCGLGEVEDKLGSFTKKALQIQLDSLPEVPVLVDVACVSAQLDDSLLYAVREKSLKHGSVSAHPPVLITSLTERPGGVVVTWGKVDEDFAAAEYRLQFRRGPAGGGCGFEDAYIGRETEFLVLQLDAHQEALFRVCARGEGRTEWSPWSIPLPGATTLPPHEWRPASEGYVLSSRKNMALRSDSAPGPGSAPSPGPAPRRTPVLYSNSPTYFCGQTLTFKVSAAGPGDRRDSVGVCVECDASADSLQRDQAVCISTNGAVFVNGKEMTNQLPAIGVGSTVTFDMEVVNLLPVSNSSLSDGGSFKLRVTIGSGNREVVFDWLLDQGVDCLFFGCSFTHPNWKLLVF